MIKLILHWLQDGREQPFGYIKLVCVFLAIILTTLFIAYIMPDFSPATLFAENGLIEELSVIFWIVAFLLCILALFRRHDRFNQLIFSWFCLICGLAAAREIDAQVLLNPSHFGQYGVHYRTDWFFSNEFGVSIILKLAWGVVFIAALAFLVAPLIILHRPIMRLIRSGDTATGFFFLGTISLAIGFIMDDILRGSHLMSLNLRLGIEETSEMLGSIFYFAGILCLLWISPSQRIAISAEYNKTKDMSDK